MRVVIACLALLISSGFCDRVRPYINFKLVKATAGSAETLNRILEKLHDIDDLRRDHEQNSVELVVSPDDLDTVSRVVTEENGELEVLHENLQESIDEEFRHFDMRRKKRQAVTLEDSIKEFMTLDELYAFQDRIVSSCNQLANVEKKTIGYSAENNPINVIKISKDQNGSTANKKTIFIEAGIHAREWLSPATANYMIYQLTCNEENRDMLDLFSWEILPSLNPDGYNYTHNGVRLWRKNRQKNAQSNWCVGTDLNRNFAPGFGRRGASTYMCNSLYRGRFAYSAPEAKALKDYVLSIKSNIASYLAIHTYGQYILLPWGYTGARPADYDSLVALAKRADEAMFDAANLRFKIGTAYSSLYPAAGISADFARDIAGIARTYTWELMPKAGRGSAGFAPKENLVPIYTPTIWKGIRAYIQGVADDIGITLEEQTTATPTEQPTTATGSATETTDRATEAQDSATEVTDRTTDATERATEATVGETTTMRSITTTESLTSTTTPPVTRPNHIHPLLWNFLQKRQRYRFYQLWLQRLINRRPGL